MAAALAAVAVDGPGGVKGRAIAREAHVHHAQIQQMFGSVDDLLKATMTRARDLYINSVFEASPALPDPLAIAHHPEFWRAITQVLLDPGPVELADLATGGPAELLISRLAAINPTSGPATHAAVAMTWIAAPLGALVFRGPLQRGLTIADEDWPACWAHLGARLEDLAHTKEMEVTLEPHKVAEGDDRPPAAGAERSTGRDRLLDAAIDLLATRLETSVTGRELAAHAGVNYGLVNHHYGSKAAVFDAALLQLHQAFLTTVLRGDAAGDLHAGPQTHRRSHAFPLLEHRPFLRAWASRLLGHRPVPDFELRGMAQTVDRLVDRRGTSTLIDAKADALAAIALQLGWALVRPLATASTATSERAAADLGSLEAGLVWVNRWLLATNP
ncbi:MAG: TetR/AcrR family transcriptional regulator [Actinomycetota bacterium]|nr:TetR/AcrR family transcriptional regulator [Actinomycetota bacterium]